MTKAKKRATKKKFAKREMIAPRGDKRYIRRDTKGGIKESDDVGRSLSHDRRRKAKKKAAPGQGDRGDRRPEKSRTRKKTSARRSKHWISSTRSRVGLSLASTPSQRVGAYYLRRGQPALLVTFRNVLEGG